MDAYPLYNLNYLLCMIPAFIIMMIAQISISSAYNKWSKVAVSSGATGAAAAQKLIAQNNLSNVQLKGVSGTLSDHYDPRTKTLALSQAVANQPSVASVAVAAHELGHAMQDREGYFPLKVRALLAPAVSIGSYVGWIMLAIGIALNYLELAWLGVAVFAIGFLFALATVPVEMNASARARKMLSESGIVQSGEEARGVNAVLNAAALTYIGALTQAVMQLLYFISMVLGMGRRRS
ncbi:MAG: zinc metallopeptidase [Anaerolineaceae bacterium]|nr:zinc metallopeptidase [Anaerolineaceae bacterium]